MDIKINYEERKIINTLFNNVRDLITYSYESIDEYEPIKEEDIENHTKSSYKHYSKKLLLLMMLDVALEQILDGMKKFYQFKYNVAKKKLYYNPQVVEYAYNAGDISNELKETLIVKMIRVRNKVQHDDLWKSFTKSNLLEYASVCLDSYMKLLDIYHHLLNKAV